MVLKLFASQPILCLFFCLPGVYYLLSTPAPCPGILIFPPIAHHHHHKAQVLSVDAQLSVSLCLLVHLSAICSARKKALWWTQNYIYLHQTSNVWPNDTKDLNGLGVYVCFIPTGFHTRIWVNNLKIHFKSNSCMIFKNTRLAWLCCQSLQLGLTSIECVLQPKKNHYRVYELHALEIWCHVWSLIELPHYFPVHESLHWRQGDYSFVEIVIYGWHGSKLYFLSLFWLFLYH